jgi:Tol biopolymer transport system component
MSQIRPQAATVLILGSILVVGCGANADSEQPGRAMPSGPILYQGPEGLVVVEAGGQDPRPALPSNLVHLSRHPDWSPDGTRFAFTVDETDGTRDIWVAAADGSQAELLVDCVDPCRDADNPAWSPDGSRIAFNRIVIEDGLDTGSTVEVVDPSTGSVEEVLKTSIDQWAGAMRWAPDGQRLAVELLRWASADADETRITGGAIGVIDVGTVPATLDQVTDMNLHASYPDWHPTEELILFEVGEGDPFAGEGSGNGLATVRPDGSGLTRLTEPGPGQPRQALPEWQPDGEGILVTVIHDIGDHSIQFLDRTGANAIDLVDPATGEPLRGAHARQAATVAG